MLCVVTASVFALPWLTLAIGKTHAKSPTTSASSPDGKVSLTLSDPVVGYIAATIHGPAGAAVALARQRPTGARPISQVILPAGGTLTIHHLLTWLCTSSDRVISASLVPATPAATATASIITPTCATRLRVKIPAASRVGGAASVDVRDTWGIGGAPLTVCVTAPGGPQICHTADLPEREATATVAVPTPRPGGWIITAQATGGRSHERTVWVHHLDDHLTLLAAGDSEMQILDDDITDDLAPKGVAVTSDARVSTSLSNPTLFNWQTEAHREADHLRPDVSVVFMGANEGFAVPAPGGGSVNCCGPEWVTGYARLVQQMATTLLRDSAGRVYWYLLPTPKPANFQKVFDVVNAALRQASAALPGRMALIDTNAFFTPGNVYRNEMSYAGTSFTIHETDGIHLDATSDTIAATLLVRQLIADRVIR